ncbi:Protein kinase domain-containing protein [Forsythia ovata]|uniref:Protein kinase domain-containing protein n=1 Tax=Forsythia ovata TaxID=205694 RepID=A0ABD1WM22_9LAMI
MIGDYQEASQKLLDIMTKLQSLSDNYKSQLHKLDYISRLKETFLLECLSALIIVQLLQTSSASHNIQCNSSACGKIPIISYPFRLKEDPQHCGESRYELVCENNTASLYLNSNKYRVQAIHYLNFTIHLVDAALKNDSCSFPQYSLSQYNFYNNYTYSTYNLTKSEDSPKLSWPVTFMSCPYPVNSSMFLETSHCDNRFYASNASYSSTRRYTYVKVGYLNVSDVRDMCSIDLIVMTSWPFKDVNNISLSEIHDSLIYGFELSWYAVKISDCKKKEFCKVCYSHRRGYYYLCGKMINFLSSNHAAFCICYCGGSILYFHVF